MEELQNGTEAIFMQDRAVRSLGKSSHSSLTAATGRQQANLWPIDCPTSLRHASPQIWLYRSLVVLCWWLGIANDSAQAVDPNNILLDFSAKWCGPCKQMSSIVSKLEHQGYPIRKVDVDQEPELTRQYEVGQIPCFVLIANGREVTRLTGIQGERELRQLMTMLPRQNIDEAVFGKTAGNKGISIPPTNSTPKSADEKKPFLKLLARNADAKNADVKLTPTDADTVRGQSPSLEATADSLIRDLLLVSARIRVKDGTRLHYGSGTIIESQPGRSIILTCGHIFRDLGNDATIEVDVYNGSNSKPQTVFGQVLKVDTNADIGLLMVSTERPLPTIKLAGARKGPSPKDRVLSIGCGGGQRPTCEDHVVTGINKFIGPDTVECTGLPQQGRSGGGLFLGSELVGVCIAADPAEKRGIYTGLKPVAELLGAAHLGHLAPSYQPASNLLATNQAAEESISAAAAPALGTAGGLNGRQSRRTDDDVAGLMEAATRAGSTPSASPDFVGAEIVCIVRPKTPGGASRVVIVNQASSRFVDDLLHESTGGARPDTAAAAGTKAVKRPATDAAKAVSRLAMQKSAIDETNAGESSHPIETSFEPRRYRRNRD